MGAQVSFISGYPLNSSCRGLELKFRKKSVEPRSYKALRTRLSTWFLFIITQNVAS